MTSQWGADLLIPFGKYLLLNRISVGATAAVYRAKIQGEAGFERLVGIKRILPHMAGDPAFVETFVREAKIAARLNHTNICPIYELGKVGESIYMAMECIAGKDLSRVNRVLADQGKTMPPVMAAWIASRLCEALDYAHTLKDARGRATGIIHRDLSPTNIVISYEGQVKLIDFGVAKATGRAQQTNVDALKKKLGYMSPEMVRGKPVDQRSDVFGVGITLFEMITGKRLFSGKDDMATLSMVGKATAPPPSAVIEDVPEELEEIVMKALAREPEDRYQSAGDMNDALINYLAQTAPTYGTRQLAQWMEASFGREMEQERRTITELLEASHRPGLVEERRRYFASPMGAAAAARAQMAEKMSQPPPARPVTAGQSKPPSSAPKLPGPPALPSRRSASKPPSGPPAQKAKGFSTWNDGEIDSLVDDGFDRISNPPAPRATSPSGRPASNKPASPVNDDRGFDDEATGFYDAPSGPVTPIAPLPKPPSNRPAVTAPTTPALPTNDFYAGGGGFDEGATQIFFNKDEDIGISELMEEDIAQQSLNPKALAVHHPGQVRVAPPPAQRSLPPATGMPPARSIAPSAPQTAVAPRTPTPQPFRQSIPPEARTATAQAPSGEVRRAHTLRMQAVQPAAKDRNLLVWIGAGLMIAAAALGVFVWLRNPGVGAIEVRTIPTRAKVVLDGVHRGEAPLRLDGVHAGMRRVEIRSAGYETVLREIDLQKGATAMLDVVLTKIPVSTTPTIVSKPVVPATTEPAAVAPATGAPTAAPTPATPAPPTNETTPARNPPRRPSAARRAPTPSKGASWAPPPAGASSGSTWGPPGSN